MVSLAPHLAQARLRDYLDDIARVDIARVAGVRRNPRLVTRLLTSLARNEATTASNATLLADLAEGGVGSPARSTIRAYLDELERIFVIEPLPAWSTHLRSPVRLRKTPKRYFTDPALAVAALAGSPSGVERDLEMMGLLFESMAMRDLRVYAQSFGARLYYYRDETNLEADAIIDGLGGRWGGRGDQARRRIGHPKGHGLPAHPPLPSGCRSARRSGPPHRAYRLRTRLPDE